MEILVAIKRVVDYKAVVRLKADGSAVDTANVKMSMNPFDEIAVEEAVRLKEKGLANKITVVCIGGNACQDILRAALAMGADQALLLKTDAEIQPLTAAKLLQHVMKEHQPQLVILGKQAIDSDNNQVGQMLAGLLNWPQGTFASKIELDQQSVTVIREIDGGLETVALQLPAVVTTDLRLNEPRYLSLPNIVKAKSKPLNIIDASTLGLDLSSRIKTLKVELPQKRREGVRVASVVDLVHQLKQVSKVI